DDYGLPKELFYVGLIESGYYLGAKSHAGAVGPWQFIRDTGRRYGLTIRSGIDERRSIAKSTQAAALYFQDLYNIFGNWELALSAYNAGEYGIVRRIRKAKTRDYYELSAKRVLPKETIHYVPKVLAAMKIMQNPKKYNIRPPKVKADLYANTKEVTLKNSVKIDYLAKKTGVSKSQILALNPDIYWRTIPYVRNGFKIYLPNKDYKVIESINSSARRVAQNSSSSSSYKVRKGDNLISIARRYNVGLNELKRANRIRRSNHIRVGQRLKIPGLAQAAQTYRVKSGDNLISIAKRFNVSLTQLKGINRIKRSNHIRIGQNLKIPGASEQLVVYKVKRGDNLYELARRNHTSISKILKLNNLRKRTIYVGQKLSLPKRTKNFYTVRPGDYLLKIAKKHGISVKELKTLNSINRSKIYPGQKLVVDIN
ncbi:MAG: LysM peptidoglycan-binding domain-containing protein, partial [Bacteriovoracaceae bacterium]